MSRRGPLCSGILSGFFVLLSVATFTPRAQGQSQEEVTIQSTGQMVRVCKPADLDSKVSFFSVKTHFIVAFNLKNISESPCVSQPNFGPWFDKAQDPQVKPFGLCFDCEDRLPNGTYRVHDPVVLSPGEVAHQTLRWNTVPPTAAVKCLQLHALFGPVLVIAPTLLKQVCSEIAVSRAHAGAFVSPAMEDQEPSYEAQAGQILVLSLSKPRYYLDELFALHVGLADPGSEPPSGEQCPTLFLRERSPDGSTRFDQVAPMGFRTCKTYSLGANRNADWQSGFQVDSGAFGLWTGIGEHSFELFQPDGSSRDGQIQFVHSNKLTVQIDDPALIPRKWLGKAKGVGVDVTLDKDVYQLGEDVPLHIAVENFDAPVPIYATSPVWDPFTAIGIEVRDATGRLLAENERYHPNMIWTGHGLGPFPFPPGKIVTMERTLSRQGWLPNRPGVYTVVVSWCPLDGTGSEAGPGLPQKGKFKTYATVQATATFRIVGQPSPASRSKP